MPLRLAWVRPGPADSSDPLDHSAALVAHLAASHDIERIDERRVHDLVWMHARGRFDLCVFELTDTPSHAFIWPYLLNYPGVLYLRASSLRASRAATLHRTRRADDYAAEARFSRRELLYAPLVASRLVVVGDAHVARRLAD